MANESSHAKVHTRLWNFIRILNVRLRFIFLMALVGVVSANWENLMNHYDRWRRPNHAQDTAAHAEIEYYCPMHPNIVRTEPGNCPICGMPLAKRAKSGQVELPPDALARLQLSPFKVQMGRIATSPIEYRLLGREIRTVGIIEYDETRRAYIPAQIKGRIDKLFVNYVGQHVEKGEPLVWIYSPDLLVAQEELLSAAQRRKSSQNATPFERDTATSLFEASRRKLSLWGITDEQIDQIIERGSAETHLTIYSPITGIVTEKNVLEGHYVNEGDDLYTIADLSNVWLQAKVFEDEVGGLTIGTAVEVGSVAYSDEIFAGRITFIAYTVDPGTRTVSARIEVDNPELQLKPGMYVRATIHLPVGQVQEVDPNAKAEFPNPEIDTRDVVKAYLTLTDSLAQDKIDDTAIKELASQAHTLAQSSAETSNHLLHDLAELVDQLQGKDLESQRTLFKSISEKIIKLIETNPPRT